MLCATILSICPKLRSWVWLTGLWCIVWETSRVICLSMAYMRVVKRNCASHVHCVIFLDPILISICSRMLEVPKIRAYEISSKYCNITFLHKNCLPICWLYFRDSGARKPYSLAPVSHSLTTIAYSRWATHVSNSMLFSEKYAQALEWNGEYKSLI